MSQVIIEQLSIVDISQIIFNIGASFAGIWAVFQYFKTRRTNAVKWTQQLFEDFYVKNHFDEGRNLLEYEYEASVVPVLRMRVVDRDISLDKDKRARLAEIDKLLNYFEHLIYLEQSGLIASKDRKVFFDYWFSLLSEPKHGSLRRYLRKCGYERLADETKTQDDELVVLSPSFQKTELALKLIAVSALKPAGHVRLAYEEDGESCFIAGTVAGKHDVFKLSNIKVLRQIDAFFDFQRGCGTLAGLQRVCVQSTECRRDVWIHVRYQ